MSECVTTKPLLAPRMQHWKPSFQSWVRHVAVVCHSLKIHTSCPKTRVTLQRPHNLKQGHLAWHSILNTLTEACRLLSNKGCAMTGAGREVQQHRTRVGLFKWVGVWTLSHVNIVCLLELSHWSYEVALVKVLFGTYL